MKKLAKETWQIVKLNWGNIFLFEFLYRLVTLPFYLQLLDQGLRFALRMAGYSYLTAGNIGSFLIRPWTILTVFLLAGMGTLLLSLEIAGLITAFEGAAYGQKLTPLPVLLGGLQKLGTEIRRKNWKLGLVLLLDYFLISLFPIVRALMHVKPVSFVVQEIAGDPWAQAGIAVLLTVGILVAVPGMFLSFGCMVEQKSFSDSFVRSRSLLKRHSVRAVGLLLGCNLAAVLLMVLSYLFSVFVAAVFVVLFTDKNLAMAVLLFVSDQLELLLLFGGAMLLVVVNFGALAVLYYQYSNRRYHESRWDFSDPYKGRHSRRRIQAAVCGVMVVSLFYIFDLVYNGSALTTEILTETQITAHRGSSRTAPENTMAAIVAAADELADYAEIDVQLTADGVVVLGHDANLKRVAGVNRAIGALTCEELRQLDVGGWFSPEYEGEPIPTLEEAMEFAKGKLKLNIEIKNVGKDSALPEKVVELIRTYGMEEQCVVTSTSLNYLMQVRELMPELRTGYIISAAYGDFYSSDAVDFISIRSSFINERLVDRVHAQGKTIHAWTVNSKSEMERLRLLGVDNLITDYPVLAREIIYRKEATETLMEYLRLVFR